MTRHLPQISDDEAKRLWQRAAELQDEAERAATARSHAVQADETHLSLEHVAQAAEGAGIQANFVLMAMAEQQLPDADEIRRADWRARWLRASVSHIDAIEVSRLVRGAPEAVLVAAREIAAQPAFNMLLENTVGTAEETGDRILVYRLQGGSSQFNRTLNFADVRVLLVTLRPAQEGTHVRVRAPLFRRGVNSVAAARRNRCARRRRARAGRLSFAVQRAGAAGPAGDQHVRQCRRPGRRVGPDGQGGRISWMTPWKTTTFPRTPGWFRCCP